MANNYTEIMKIVNQGNKMGLSNTITRDNGIPLDLSSVQETYEAAIVYAATKAIAYQGQLLAAEGVVYIIVAESQGQVEIDGETYENYLKPVGTIPGFDSADNGTLPQIKIDAEGNRTLEWVAISAIVEGDGNSVTTLVALDKSVTIADTAEEGFEGHKYTVKVNISAEEGNSLSLKDDGLYVAVPEITHPEYAVVADEREEGAVSTTYHLTKDGENVDVAIVVPDAYDDEALDTRLTVVEGTVGDHETRIDKIEEFFATAEGETLDQALDTLIEIQNYIDGHGEVAEQVLANKTAIETLNGTGEGSVDKKIADALDAYAEEAVETFATKQDLTDHSNTMDTKLNDYLKSADAEDTYAKIGDAYTKAEVDNLIGTPGVPAVKNEEGGVETEAVPGTGIFVNAYSKAEVNALLDEVSGGSSETAASVKRQLDEYKDTNNARVLAVETKNSEQDTAINNAQSAAEAAQSAADAAQGAADDAAAQAATNKSDIASIITRLGNVETASGTNTSKVGALEGRVTALEAEDLELAEQIGTVSGNLTTLESSLMAKDSELAALISGNTENITANANAIKDKVNAADVYTKEEVDDLLSNLDQTEINEAIAANTQAIADEKTRAEAAEKANADAIAALVGEDTGKTVRSIAAEEVAAIVDNAPEDLNTLKEIADYIASDKTNAAEINNKLAAYGGILAGLEDTTVVDYVASAIAEIPSYELPAATAELLGGVKLSNEIGVNEGGQLKITKVTTDVLVNGAEELVLFGGNAGGATNA